MKKTNFDRIRAYTTFDQVISNS